MTLLLPNSAFIHIPKTGGNWVRTALENNGLVERRITQLPNPSYSYETIEITQHNVPLFDTGFLQRRHVFSFVRNPVTWYISYWKQKQSAGWLIIKNFDRITKADNFGEWISNVCAAYPYGYFSRMLEFYTQVCTFVGKQENLVEDLKLALITAGERYSPDLFPKEPINQSDAYPIEPVYTISQLEGILTIENQAMGKYGYSTEIDFYRQNIING